MENRGKTILLWVIILIVCFIGIPIHYGGTDDEAQLTSQFNNFTQQYGKSYKTPGEKEKKFAAFRKSLEEIRRLNSVPEGILQSQSGEGNKERKLKSWQHGQPKNQGAAFYGVNPFSDMSRDEFESHFLNPHMSHHIERHRKSHHHPASTGTPFDNLITRKKRALVANLPAKVDWRDKGIVTPVKQQKSCGACWAFSTVETVESMNAMKNGKLEPLSVQQVIDCSKNGNLGCNGGDTCTAIEWMTGRQLATEQQYPTTLKTETCLLLPEGGVRVNSNYSCKSFVGNENSLLSVLASHGPVTVAVDATNWQYYVGGIIQWNCPVNLNHAVQVVGYDQSGETPHYIVRNSWGTGFGDQGYLYVAAGSNLCGIADRVAWLSVS